jgi:REP element-mobilizing transposase RayT
MGKVRVRGHDYRAKGYYFITIGTHNRRQWLSRIERGQVILDPAGELLMEAWRKIAIEDPAYELGVTAIMPDHFHGLAIARKPPKYVIGTHVSRVEGRVVHAMRKRMNDPQLQIWDKGGFYDYLSLDIRMLRAFERYILDNPARWQLRQDHPEWFKKQYAVVHPRLPAETCWTAYGDATLLDHPNLVPVIVSTKITETERAAQVSTIIAKVKEGAVPIGGFISPGEREVAVEVSNMPRARIIKLEPWGLKRYKPTGAIATRWLAEGRTLVLTGFPDDEPVECRRMNCLKNNEWVRRIAGAQAPETGAQAPETGAQAPPLT